MQKNLKGTLQSQNADFGILITFRPPTKGMIAEAVKEGSFSLKNKEIPKIQFLTVEDLFKKPIPIALPQTFILEPFKKPIIGKDLNLTLNIE